jgi:cyclopropane fatty-acyl-phospholipid synthase-like methyltransferase
MNPISIAARDTQAQNVARYYDAINFDFFLAWTNREAQALHFGYWDAHTRTQADAQLNLNRVLAERVGMRADMDVLDAGCGIGGSSIWLAENYRARVMGITLSQVQVQHAARRAKQRGIESLARFEIRDYSETNFHTASFDVVWALESMCHALSKRHVAAEAFRVLKPGGKFIVADGFRTARPFLNDDEALMTNWLSGWAIPDIDTPQEFTRALQEVGFVNIEMEDATEPIRPSIKHLEQRARWFVPPGKLAARLGLLSPIRLRNGEASHACYRAFQCKLSMYGIFSATKP